MGASGFSELCFLLAVLTVPHIACFTLPSPGQTQGTWVWVFLPADHSATWGCPEMLHPLQPPRCLGPQPWGSRRVVYHENFRP